MRSGWHWIAGGLLVAGIGGNPAAQAGSSLLLLDAIGFRFPVPERASVTLSSYEAIQVEDLPDALKAGREDGELTQRDCIKLAAYAYNLEQYDEAQHFIERAVALPEPTPAIAYEIQGWLLERQRRWPEAAAVWSKRDHHRPSEAEELYEEVEPDVAWPIRTIYLKLRQNHVQAALRDLTLLSAEEQGQALPLFLRGYCHYQTRQIPRARRYFLQASTRKPDPEPLAFLGLAVLSHDQDEMAEARGWVQRALLGLPFYLQIQLLCHDGFTSWFDQEGMAPMLSKLDLPSSRQAALVQLPEALSQYRRLLYKDYGDIRIEFVLRTPNEAFGLIRFMNESGQSPFPLRLASGKYRSPESLYLVQLNPAFNPWDKLWTPVPKP